MATDIETKVQRRASELGYGIGWQHVGDGRVTRIVMHPETGAVFAQAKDYYGLLPFLWRAPSIKGRYPRPSPEDLARELAASRGYRVIVRPNGGIAILDPAKPERAVAVLPFWLEVLRAVLEWLLMNRTR